MGTPTEMLSKWNTWKSTVTNKVLISKFKHFGFVALL